MKPPFAPVAVFRADASVQIGTGHVMRCLTLADGLSARGLECKFVCSEQVGHMADVIARRGYGVHLLPVGPGSGQLPYEAGVHASWLGTSWERDAAGVRTFLIQYAPQWLVVDHYAIDGRWERSLADACGQILVIDDLADRRHDCTILLDQSVGRDVNDYEGLIDPKCKCLVGPQYSLLRPEFRALRDDSLKRRDASGVRRLLVTMGGVDAPNATRAVLDVLASLPFLESCHIDVVMNAQAPWLADVEERLASMPTATTLHVSPPSMARLMADSDLAIGAAGTTALERCCLGLPTLQVVLAVNQEHGAAALERAGAAICIGQPGDIASSLPDQLQRLLRPEILAEMSLAARGVTDGDGVSRVLCEMGYLA